MVSDQEFNELQSLRKFERRVYQLKNLPREGAQAIKAARMSSTHYHLNRLMDEDGA